MRKRHRPRLAIVAHPAEFAHPPESAGLIQPLCDALDNNDATCCATIYSSHSRRFLTICESILMNGWRLDSRLRGTWYGSCFLLMYAQVANRNYKRFCDPLRFHHHGEGEKALPTSAQKRSATRLSVLQ